MPTLEIAIDDIHGLNTALKAGVKRVELCSALALGGLTPSAALLELASQTEIELAVMIRPRAGGFSYTPEEVSQMCAEIVNAQKIGAEAVVFGAIGEDQQLDQVILATLIEEARGMDCVLHRAFDLCENWEYALETAIRLGFKRILTSGSMPNIETGYDNIIKMQEQAAGRIEIMPGGGLLPEHITKFRNHSNISAFHCSASIAINEPDYMNKLRISATRNATDLETITNYQKAAA